MGNSEIVKHGFASIDLEDEGSFEFILQQMQKLYSEIPDDKKSTAKTTFTDGWSGKYMTVTLR